MTREDFHDLETAGPGQWDAYQDDLVRRTVRFACQRTHELMRRLDDDGISPDDIRSLSDLERVPVLSKDRLPELQSAAPPFGGMLAVEPAELKRIFLSPGPILDPEGEGNDFWRWAPALEACGFRGGDIVYNTFSYHLTPAGAMMEEGLRTLGCTVVPGGVGNTEAQVELLAASGATGYCGTPNFLLTLCERARERNLTHALERGFVSGGPLAPSLRDVLSGEFGLVVRQGYGTADAGAIGFECDGVSGWHIAPSVVVEIVESATGKPLSPGETGEVVVTVESDVYPLVRFGTGDLSSIERSACSCGRSSPRLMGFQGRVGEGVKVRGMFVHPRQLARAVESVIKEARFQAIVTLVDHQDQIRIRVEAGEPLDEDRLARALRDELKLRVEVERVDPGELDPDGPLVRDDRQWH